MPKTAMPTTARKLSQSPDRLAATAHEMGATVPPFRTQAERDASAFRCYLAVALLVGWLFGWKAALLPGVFLKP